MMLSQKTDAVVRALLMFLAGIVSVMFVALVSAQDNGDASIPDLELLIPEAFGPWTLSPVTSIIAPAENINEEGMAVLYRTYTHKNGTSVSLVVAYGTARGDAVRLHQPHVCYRAQGYAVSNEMSRSEITPFRIERLSANNGLRQEAASYWMRTGADLVRNEIGQQVSNVLAGFGQSADSTLVRVSSPGQASREVYNRHDEFIRDLLLSVSDEAVRILIGTNSGVHHEGR